MQIGNSQEFDWIKEGILPMKEKNEFWEGNIIGNLLPDRFDKYLKILHPIYKDRFVIDKKLTWEDNEDTEGVPGERVLWRQLAAELCIEFKPEINSWAFYSAFERKWPRYLIGPHEGCMEERCLNEVISLLGKMSKQSYYFFFDYMKTSDFTELLFEGKSDEMLVAMKFKTIKKYSEREKYSPTYIWPRDKEFCINTDYDLQFTVVGCSNRFFEILSNNDWFECIEVMHSTRIDYKAMEPLLL